MPPPRRSTHGGAGKRGSSHQVALEPVGGWQGGYGDTDRMTGDDEDYDRPGVTTRAAAAGGWLAGDITNVVDMGGDGRAHQGPSKRRRGAGREGRGDGGGSADGTPGSAIPHLPGMASGVIPPLPGMAGATHQPGVQHVQELQRLWGSAQMSQMMLGQQCLMPGQLLLVQDPTNTSAQWAVMVADLGELPLEVADGLRLPHQPLAVGIPNRLPFKLVVRATLTTEPPLPCKHTNLHRICEHLRSCQDWMGQSNACMRPKQCLMVCVFMCVRVCLVCAGGKSQWQTRRLNPCTAPRDQRDWLGRTRRLPPSLPAPPLPGYGRRLDPP